MQQGSRLVQRTCSKDLGQARGYATRRINIKALCMFRCMQKAIKNPTKTRYYLCNPWSKPVRSQVDSKGGMVWSIGEWFLVKGGSRRFPLVHIFAWNAWTNGKLSSPHVYNTSPQFPLNCYFQLKLSQYIEQPTHSFDFPRRNLLFIAKAKCLF